MGTSKKGPTANRKTKPRSVLSAVSKSFKIGNKQSRERHNVRLKTATLAARRKFRIERKKEEEKNPELREERLKKNIPASLDRKRVWEAVDLEGLKAGTSKWPVVPADVLEEKLKEEKESRDGEGLGRERKKRKVEKNTQEDDTDARWLERMGEDEQDGKESSETESEGEEIADGMDEVEAVGGEIDTERVEHAKVDSKVESNSKVESEIMPTWTALMVPPNRFPRLLITTSRNSHMHEPAQELVAMFGPSATYVPRGHKKYSIKEICKWALDPPKETPKEETKPYTHVLVLNDHHKIPNKLTVITLPNGPSFHFSVTNFMPSSKIRNHGRPTSHTPELILNNFLTPLGKLTASLFQSLFPPQPEFRGRQVVTLHNQRDYIFFRRHRYVFRDKRGNEKSVGYGLDYGPGSADPTGKGPQGGDLGIKVGLQELGPQFTLKLRRVEKGIREGLEWEWKGGMEKNKKLFQL